MSNGPEVSEREQPQQPEEGAAEQSTAAAPAEEGDAREPEGQGDDEGAGSGPGLGKSLHVEPEDLPGALEALILVSDKPVAPVRLSRLTRSELSDVKAALAELREHYEGRGIVLDEVAGGYQFRTSPRHSQVVRSLIQQKPVRLTRAQLEVLSIIAYRQPVTRPEVEEVRGVDSGSALRVLLERGVIRIIGKRDDAGRPMLYATTPDFLSLFGLKNLSVLPTLKEFTELSDESRDMFERRIGERAPLEGFTDDASDARAAAEREARLREEAGLDPDPEDAGEQEGEPDAEQGEGGDDPQTAADGDAQGSADGDAQTPPDDADDEPRP